MQSRQRLGKFEREANFEYYRATNSAIQKNRKEGLK